MKNNTKAIIKKTTAAVFGIILGGGLIFTGAVTSVAAEPEEILFENGNEGLLAESEEILSESDYDDFSSEAEIEEPSAADPSDVENERIYLNSAEEISEDVNDTDLICPENAVLSLNGLYLPDVTPEMSDAAYWAGKLDYPDKVLVDKAGIDAVNQAILNGPGTNMYDLRNWSDDYYNGIALNEAVAASAAADAQYFYNVGVYFDEDGQRFASWEEALEKLYQPLIDNCQDPDASENMPVKYAVCTNRTCMLSFPTMHPLYDDPTDPDFDYLYQTMLRVNEPLVLKARSADGKYYMAISSCVSGWVSAEDVAICSGKEEWLSAWNLPDEKTLVVCEDKIYTEESYFAPETANRMLPMGTCLELADESDYTGLVINRSAYNNHVVWMPVRLSDGSYTKELALIGENRFVSEGYLPLTSANLLSVMMSQLGDTYGWGGMLKSEDCSGFSRDVYKCFGIEMARNTTWQANQPVYKFDLSSMSSEEKAEIIKKLPPGSLMIFNGHAMLYLGEDNGKFYVLSSISDVVVDGKRKRVRGALINTMDIKRGNGLTWLEAIHTAEVPYYTQDYEGELVYKKINISGIDLSTDSAVMVTGSKSKPSELELKAEILPADTTENKDVIWTSSDESIAAVDQNGKVSALRCGYAVITATSKADDSICANCTINNFYYDVTGSGIRGAADYKYWFNPVYWAAYYGITNGYDKVYFGPEENCTREQMITFLWRQAGMPEPQSTKMPFSDVKSDTYYYKAVLWGYETGITKGYTSGANKGRFGVGINVSREDTMTFIYRMAGSPSVSSSDLKQYTFSDIKDNSYYQKAVVWAAKNRIANGYSSGPDKGKYGVGFPVLRKDIVTFLYRYAG